MTDGSAGLRVDGEVPDVGDGLWERLCDAVAAESGADRSLWNGVLVYLDPMAASFGEVRRDGSIALHREFVVEPLQQMYTPPGRSAPTRPVDRFAVLRPWIERRAALKTVVHQFTHLAVSQDSHSQAGVPGRWHSQIAEGVTEAWAHARLDSIADCVLPPELADGIKYVGCAHQYPDWEPAARAFADEIGALTHAGGDEAEPGADGDEVLRRMVSESSQTMARAAADLLFDRSALPSLVPADRQAAVRRKITNVIDKGFQDLPSRDGRAWNRRAIAEAAGLKIAAASIDVVRTAEDRFRGGVAVDRHPSSPIVGPPRR
ncbi:hypothetical protein ABZX12_40845 [Kribbella sp. NPDC003505]|uniref:hypothetical protein n=1 Tax=Kribbella sp. NPDC003505 TaxID=3154448 RepID=UPI0033B75EB0